MKKNEFKIITYISIAFSSISTLAYLYFIAHNTEITSIFRGISGSITVVLLFWTFYFNFAWKWEINGVQLFYRPNLNGTWKGILTTNNPKAPQDVEIEFYLVIRQTFLRIHFTSFTKTYVGISYAESFYLNEPRGIKSIAYMYRKDTTQKVDDNLQEGATELRLIKTEEGEKLQGKYFNDSTYKGTIEVDFLTRKHVDSFPEAKKIQ